MNSNIRTREQLLLKIMEADFVLNETVLYLDTHPQDSDALSLYETYKNSSKELKELYQNNFGPLTAQQVNPANGWCWVKAPWPWEE